MGDTERSSPGFGFASACSGESIAGVFDFVLEIANVLALVRMVGRCLQVSFLSMSIAIDHPQRYVRLTGPLSYGWERHCPTRPCNRYLPDSSCTIRD